MYSTCIFCNGSLGSNEAIDVFPIGRRLAFDQAKGRLWVVCRKCQKWNLTPFEERWEALETCERLYRDARKRVSTDNIGLARLNEGLELVRIGEALRPEFAAWRYGDQFGRRRRKRFALSAAAGTMGMGMLLAGPAVGGLGMFAYAAWEVAGWSWTWYRRRRLIAEFTTEDGDIALVRAADAQRVRLVPADDDWGWRLAIPLRSGPRGGRDELVLTGAEARHGAALIVPQLTFWGASRRETRAAVARIEAIGDPASFLAWQARHPHGRRLDPRSVGWKRSERSARDTSLDGQGGEVCLAVEMAVNEENERVALREELERLEETWRQAEEIAAIADQLALPEEVDAKLADLKRH